MISLVAAGLLLTNRAMNVASVIFIQKQSVLKFRPQNQRKRQSTAHNTQSKFVSPMRSALLT
jgi:hypothetical protein